ncbi:hypothetical protein G9A89_014469 [Geosiphon pyriformis]|nr:hypothetical protein G9A89_014469 [Geosiphon pyriformis]
MPMASNTLHEISNITDLRTESSFYLKRHRKYLITHGATNVNMTQQDIFLMGKVPCFAAVIKILIAFSTNPKGRIVFDDLNHSPIHLKVPLDEGWLSQSEHMAKPLSNKDAAKNISVNESRILFGSNGKEGRSQATCRCNRLSSLGLITRYKIVSPRQPEYYIQN